MVRNVAFAIFDWFVKRTGRIRHGNLGRGGRSGFCVEGSEPEGSEALGFSGKEKRSDRVLPAGLEPGVHERARLLRERYEAIRAAGRAGAGNQRGQRVVAQGLRGKNGDSLSVAGGFSAARRGGRKIRRVPG